MQFDTRTKFREHKRTHKKQQTLDDSHYSYTFDSTKDVYNCITCDYECHSIDEIKQHVSLHKDRFTCSTCNVQFEEPYEYATHVNVHTGNIDFKCPLCDAYQTASRNSLLIHINTYHLKRYYYRCNTCGKGFNDCVQFKEHTNNVHQGLRPFKCVVCGKDFVFSTYLHTHQIRNHKVIIDGIIGTNQCYICLRRCANLRTLQRHIKKHENRVNLKRNEKRHLCDICGKRYDVKAKLDTHYRTHTGEKPFACSYCPKSFTKREYLTMHERVHSGEKPYAWFIYEVTPENDLTFATFATPDSRPEGL
ncbi:zinc finger protein 235-like [Agrilus planipennis]|uniref:Zinc finger protein 235-like n=1 Tax=Agrilus planipennis TaxID=224129 RepID=A0A1W4XH21_AGRPL|nr:zinc finger protein 235-like [Agrilus planipennis]